MRSASGKPVPHTHPNLQIPEAGTVTYTYRASTSPEAEGAFYSSLAKRFQSRASRRPHPFPMTSGGRPFGALLHTPAFKETVARTRNPPSRRNQTRFDRRRDAASHWLPETGTLIGLLVARNQSLGPYAVLVSGLLVRSTTIGWVGFWMRRSVSNWLRQSGRRGSSPHRRAGKCGLPAMLRSQLPTRAVGPS